MEDPLEIARLLGVHYDGIQIGVLGRIPDKFQFTDDDFTLSTFYGVSLESAFGRLVEIRQRFNKSGRCFPIPSFEEVVGAAIPIIDIETPEEVKHKQ